MSKFTYSKPEKLDINLNAGQEKYICELFINNITMMTYVTGSSNRMCESRARILTSLLNSRK